MINLDTRILEHVTSDELWLLIHIVKRFDERLICWPSNKTLCVDTGWSLKKMQGVKAQLIEKGLLIARVRYFDKSQSSNEYMIDSEFLGVYVPAKRIPIGLQSDTPMSKLPTPPESIRTPAPESETDNKVLTSEVLVSPKASKAKKEENEFPEYKQFVEAFHQKYPTLLKFPRDGAKVKELIAETRRQLAIHGMEVTHENAVEFWTIFVANIHRTWAAGKMLHVIASHYPSLILELENGKQQFTRKTASESASDYIDNIAKGHRPVG